MNRSELESHIKSGLGRTGLSVVAASLGDTVMVHIDNVRLDLSKTFKFNRLDIMDHRSAAYVIMRAAVSNLSGVKPAGLYSTFQGVAR